MGGSESRARIAIVGLLLATTAFHLLFISRTDLDLFPDEAQYWDWSRQPDWGYYSKPPLVAWTILGSRTVVGESSPFAVRLPAVLMATATTFLVYRLSALAAGGRMAGVLAAVGFRLAPVFISEAVVLSTDSLLLLCWTLSGLFFYRAIVKGRKTAWLGAGLALGLGLLSKYSMLVALTWAAGPMIALGHKRPGHGKWIAAGSLIALLAFVPPLIWNWQHDWASFRHVAAGAGKPGHLGSIPGSTTVEFLAAQLGVMTPVLFGGVVWALVACWRGWKERKDETDLFLLWGSLPILLMYLATSFVGRSEANWPAPGYVAGLAAFVRHGLRLKPRLVTVALLAAVPFAICAYDFELIYKTGLELRPKQDPTMRMRGWKELGAAVGQEVAKWPGERPPFVLADSYQITAQLAFYVPGQPRVYCADVGRRRCQYDYWPGISSFVGRDAVYATEGDFPKPHHLLRRAFTRVERAETLVYERRGKPARWFSIFRLYGFKGQQRPDYEEY